MSYCKELVKDSSQAGVDTCGRTLYRDGKCEVHFNKAVEACRIAIDKATIELERLRTTLVAGSPEFIRQAVLAKLSMEERRALGLESVTDDRKRVRGCIQKAAVEYDGDHQFWTCRVYCEMGCTEQSFGNLCLDSEAQASAFASDVQALFGVASLDQLRGKEFTALYCLGHHNEPMEGMESPDGKRFTITGFRRRYWPDTVSAFDSKFGQLKQSVEFTERRLREEQRRLTTLRANWTEWETAP